MDAALVLSGVLMGVAGVPHCAAMCGASSTALVSRCARSPEAAGATAWSFQLMRVLGYAAAGAAVASSVGVLKLLGEASPALRPLWTLLHAAALALGLWLLIRGRQPGWMSAWPRSPAHTLPPALAAQGWQRVQGPAKAGLAGAAWVAWPCGLLQSALVVAALAGSPMQGALVMAGFAATSSTGLWAATRLWAWAGRAGSTTTSALTQGWFVRVAGLCLIAASGWALGHGLWQRVAVLCGLA